MGLVLLFLCVSFTYVEYCIIMYTVMLYYIARLSFKITKPCAYVCVRACEKSMCLHVMKAYGGMEVNGHL
jgi:hypothetical protein